MKTILTFSGGLDSCVLLSHLLADGREVKALSVNYGQRHARELQAATAICKRLNVEHFIADLSGLRPLLKGSSQTDNTVPVPHGHYAEESMKLTVVPNRNMMLLAVAGMWAVSEKAQSIAYAAHAGDHAVYPDCREEFVTPLAEALQNADWHKVSLERPFLYMTKAEIAKHGAELNAPMELSWSCYDPQGEKHCGKCGTCVERREAFQLAGVLDPTIYVS